MAAESSSIGEIKYYAPKAAIDALNRIFKNQGDVVKGDDFKELLIDRHLKELVNNRILKQEGNKRGPKATRGKLSLLVPVDAIQERKRGRTASAGDRTPKPAAVRRARGQLTLQNLVIFTDELRLRVEAREADVTRTLRDSLIEASQSFSTKVEMGAGGKALEHAMKAVVEARKAVEDAGATILKAALVEMSKEGKYPPELIKVMQGKDG